MLDMVRARGYELVRCPHSEAKPCYRGQCTGMAESPIYAVWLLQEQQSVISRSGLCPTQAITLQLSMLLRGFPIATEERYGLKNLIKHISDSLRR